ncbi:MAG: molybdopterin-binding protein [Novosphingobium sp. 28-62-57]|uniref:molybdopterin-dependent oxidoreductase n=1 Tax=unclassified Novosphingobium TaxID=2644732 RepID=UPI000BCEA3CA|nr:MULTISPECIES: molybdopterin-dependent oxidoreductase [unclassified Novosphingobium]OYW49754.1 MAG: molybdopterin-binding protein [Novosphingobium sp. 12-62-10]OYZ12290.1 MAG: molybdopterin-binding protein [Novosphingobium sp. 28-62-57]OZA33241.1 MAG: molybdopterin-binding protein [Novosphingobium sp. 17-62-9]HQS70839.1 molybdopterin-dependent oxidoreductase [Novosphingobium sp.]
MISRRNALIGVGALTLSGCDAVTRSPTVRKVLTLGEKATLTSQRLVTDRNALAPEFTRADLSPRFRVNGNSTATSAEYLRHAASNFTDWKLEIGGKVARPFSLSLAQLRAAPQRTQITRQDCVEGWSAIGEWTGVPLGLILRQAQVMASSQYIVFHCADDFSGVPYYESIDMIDALHPQTILAHTMNGQPLPIGHGAPIRLRVERALGYKQAKFVMRIEAVESLAGFHGGGGGFWEDRSGYQWFAGI